MGVTWIFTQVRILPRQALFAPGLNGVVGELGIRDIGDT